ncbi:MAG: SulP family inorganic anion transporter [Alphaproteobacteria bacterium]|nr:SulP family inorganic anion transporter [Alphaproteobacteria bacterium]
MAEAVSKRWVGEVWGGLAAMLVAVPSSIAFGVTIFSPLGAEYAAYGAVAGILGTVALGLTAPALGGTNRLITAPCAPAAAVMAAFALELSGQGMRPEQAVVMLTATALLCGLMQVGFGAAGLGRLIKYMPYPVVSGYLSGVGLVIVVSQIPRFLGVPKGTEFWTALASPSLWAWQGMIVGGVTAFVMLTAGRVTKLVPAAILGLVAGVAAYFALGLFDRSLWTVNGNALVVGPLGGSDKGLVDAGTGNVRSDPVTRTGRRDAVISHSAWFKNSVRSSSCVRKSVSST